MYPEELFFKNKKQNLNKEKEEAQEDAKLSGN